MNDRSTDARSAANPDFLSIVDQVGNIGLKTHRDRLVFHAQQNLPRLTKTLRNLPALRGKKAQSGIVISAGPSVHKKKSIRRILDSGYQGTIIAVDGTYAACLREGLIPDYVLTLDPHPTRIVSLFGDPNFEENWGDDDYLSRQDLDINYRTKTLEKNAQNMELANKYGHLTKAIVSSSAPINVVDRVEEARFDTYWWNPLVDDPKQPNSITRELYSINKLPCMNTGGNVGTAAWVFASHTLKLPEVAIVGMDFGYYKADTSYKQTQTYYELILHTGDLNLEEMGKYFQDTTFPLTGEKFFTDPTYYWYGRNFFQVLDKAENKTYNCTEGGTLFSEKLPCIYLDEFLTKHK